MVLPCVSWHRASETKRHRDAETERTTNEIEDKLSRPEECGADSSTDKGTRAASLCGLDGLPAPCLTWVGGERDSTLGQGTGERREKRDER